MANISIYNAFERMWLNIQNKLNETVTITDNRLDHIENEIANIWEVIYPVGAIYISSNSTSPASLFGGTWEAITDCVIIGAGGNYTVNSTGGAASIELLEENIPRIYGTMQFRNTSGGYNIANILDTSNAFTFVSEGGSSWSNSITTTSTAKTCDTIVFDYGGDADGNTVAFDNLPPYVAKYIWERIE